MEAIYLVDENYEFSAPRFFDFLNKETEEQIHKAEQWFETCRSYAPSPFMPKIRKGRPGVDCPSDFGDEEKIHKEPEVLAVENHGVEQDSSVKAGELQMVVDMELIDRRGSFGFDADAKQCDSNIVHKEDEISTSVVCLNNDSTFAFPVLDVATAPATISESDQESKKLVKYNLNEALTPKLRSSSIKETAVTMGSQNQTAKKAASLVKQSSVLKPKNHTTQNIQGFNPRKSAIKCPGGAHTKNALSTDISQENQAIKRQKLEGGLSKKIHNVKAPVLLHKSKPGLCGGNDLITLALKCHQEQRREVEPYISTAEMIQKFQSRTREIELPHKTSFSQDTITTIQMRPKLTLTRPKEPELETAQRVRAVRIKSTAELEEEMLAKIPKFKARPLNKKILQAPPPLPRSTPQHPDFHGFHFKTMERANQHVETTSLVSSVDAPSLKKFKPLKLTEPRPPVLETALRARPIAIKSSQELELEELEKIPKFKARPLKKKILESKGDLGLHCPSKSQLTVPQEFHFATNDRLGPPPSTMMIENFDKLSIHSESSHHSLQVIPKLTKPNPFHLYTEERGLEKEKLFTLQILEKQFEEEKARIPKAHPYPYTTDYPVMPPKPQPKQCTKPEVFHLDSLIRHDEEVQKRLEEKENMEREEAERRIFRAQPIMKEDPIPLPERERKPLTDVQGFSLHVDHRAVERSEFEKKIKEKELAGKRIREEQENEKMIEEEKVIKQMRRTMVTHARPIPNFSNPFQPHKSTKKTTKPKSPILLVNQRERTLALHLR
ncbi:protein TPX2 isoform X2 [Phalaenopsis equestris]|uniref:protein TPX2 isoform X2 n=1 Tax=Phalaenopsis equestris TaxID=78828 RepID=UPI0009E3F64C|nr:protein TPX2 isoform X2 [Phalaenopsis equestris]